MAQLTANAPKVYEAGNVNSPPVKASTDIFQGSAVGITAGYARQLVAGDEFAGFADQHINNDIATDGAKTVPVIKCGVVKLTISGVAVTDYRKPVYASDGNVFTLTAGANTFIGLVERYEAANTALVSFDVAHA